MHKFLTFLYKFIKFSGKAFRFIFRYIVKDPIFVFKYFVAYFQKDYTPQVKFYTTEEFMTEIRSGKSFIRIGDGEIGLLHHRDIHYQKADPLLISKLREIIENYGSSSKVSMSGILPSGRWHEEVRRRTEGVDSISDSNYVLSIPIFVNTSNRDLENTKGKLSCWLPLKVEFFRRFNKDMKYFDSHAFYRKGFFENNMYQYLKDKRLIINTTAENIKNQKENIESRFEVLEWIEAKPAEAFDLYQETKERIQKVIDREMGVSIIETNIQNISKKEIVKNKKDVIKKKDIVLILATGPTSKVLSYDFAKLGIQSIDIGKGFEQLYNEVDYEHEI